MLRARLSISAVNCRPGALGPDDQAVGRDRPASPGALAVGGPSAGAAADHDAGSWVRPAASHVCLKHFRVKLSDATIAGPSSATRYWRHTRRPVGVGADAAPVARARPTAAPSFFLPPLAREVTSTSTGNAAAVGGRQLGEDSSSLQRKSDSVMRRRARRMTSSSAGRRSSTDVITSRSRGPADRRLAAASCQRANGGRPDHARRRAWPDTRAGRLHPSPG